jgi:hypothetical protein
MSETAVSTPQEYLPGPRVVKLPTRRGPELSSSLEVRKEMSKVYREARRGRIKTEEAARLMYMLLSIGKQIEIAELEAEIRQEIEQLKARTWHSLPSSGS